MPTQEPGSAGAAGGTAGKTVIRVAGATKVQFTCTYRLVIVIRRGVRVLLNFRVTNHRSIRAEQQLNLGPVYGADRPADTEWDAVPVAAVFGANAAGKSNVVGAFLFMRRMVCFSQRDVEPGGGIARHPFALDAEALSEPSWYVVDLMLAGVRFTYGFGIDDERVLEEWLYSYPKGRRAKVFHRSGDGMEYGESVRHVRRELDLVREITEPNTLFISVAARSKQDAVRPVYDWFARRAQTWAQSVDRHRASRLRTQDTPDFLTSSMRMLDSPDSAGSVVKLLQAADLGIEGAGIEDVDDPRHGMRRSQVYVEQRGRRGVTRMGLADQSDGTRRLFDFAGPILFTLRDGGLLLLDEIDASLHPRLTTHLIQLFQSPESNPRRAQLVLTTHDASLLGRSGGEDILKRDQIWFVEKDAFGETTLFPLTDFKPRQEENRERRYLGGSYGAVPVLSDERFVAAVLARGTRGTRGRGEGGADPGERQQS
jgi:hypothetical protein